MSEAVEPRVIHHKTRTDGDTRRVARVVENGSNTYHIACEVTRNGRIAATGATHLYATGEKEMEQYWEVAQRWLKSTYPRVMPWHKDETLGEGQMEHPPKVNA